MQTLSTLAPALKTLYPSNVIENLTYKDHPFYAMVPKFESFVGENMKIPLIYGNPQGRSASFANAQANVTNAKLKAFFLTRVSDYSIAQITNEALLASKGNPGAFVEGLKLEVDGAMGSAGASDAHSLFEDGSGVIGKLDATTNLASTTIILDDVDSVVFFEVGQKLKLSATKGGGSVRAGSLTVVGVNRSLGRVTVDTNISTAIATATVNDFISVEGDYDSKMKGLGAWLPQTAPTFGDNFFGVDRSTDTQRLAGHNEDLSALPIEEALIEADKLICRDGGTPSHIFVNYSKYADIEKALGTKVQYVDHNMGDIGFKGLRVMGKKSVISIYADQNCQADRMYVLQMNTWKLCSLGKAVMILDTDGNKNLRMSSSDSVEIRIGGYKNLACYAPGFNGNFKIA